jgi:hypothetical protein
MTTAVAATYTQPALPSQLSIASLLSYPMAQPQYLPWSGELTLGAQTASAASSAQTSPSVSQFPLHSPGYGYGNQVSPGGRTEAHFALPFYPASEADKHSSTLDRLGFSKFLSGEKKTRGSFLSASASTAESINTTRRWPTTKAKRAKA